jgi:peptidoglycan/LPS O-acetylase OafA/YrhL
VSESSSGSGVGKRTNPSTTSGKPSSAYMPALDGIRGIAILLVIICHASEQFQFSTPVLRFLKTVAFAGWTGVDLFFVLSGFLITGILFDARGGHAYFRNFYARRTLRIFPLYYVTLLVIFVIAPAISPKYMITVWGSQRYALSRHYWAWYGTYFVDLLIAWKGFLFAGHFWTLAVEEHFYFVWPFLVHRLSHRKLIAASLFLIVVVPFLRFYLASPGSGVSPTAIYVLTPCRMDGLALGAFLALAVRRPNGLQVLVLLARIVLPISAALWIGLMYVAGRWSQYGLIPQTVGYFVTEMFYGSVLVFTLASRKLAAVVSIGPLRFLGKISYALYVFHGFVLVMVAPSFARGVASHYSIVFSLMTRLAGEPLARGPLLILLDAVGYIALGFGLSVGTALLSWHILELPCLRLRQLFPYARKDATRQLSETSRRN